MRTFQDGMRVTFIGSGNTDLHNETGTVNGEGETVDVGYKHLSIRLNANDLVLAKGQRVRLGRLPITGTVLEPADIWQRADRFNKNPDLPHTTPVHWDDDTATEELTRNLLLSDVPAGARPTAERATAVNAVIDSWWAATDPTGVYEEDIDQLKRLLAHIR